MPLWGLRFTKTSFFPNIKLDEILRMAFKLSKFFSISPFSFDDVEFFEFLTQFELMVEYKEANKPKQGLDLQSLMQGN
jgi:hypothetical protein